MESTETPSVRLNALIDQLRGDYPWRTLGDLLDFNYTNLIRAKQVGRLGAKGKLAIANYLKRKVSDIDAYLGGEVELYELLDPQFGLSESLNGFNVDTVSTWIRYRANLDEKIRLHQELSQQIAGIARGKASAHLRASLQCLLDDGQTIEKIADQTGLKPARLKQFYRGERLPCEDEVVALAPLLPENLEDLQRLYVTGV